jgi:hypothetical protein
VYLQGKNHGKVIFCQDFMDLQALTPPHFFMFPSGADAVSRAPEGADFT